MLFKFTNRYGEPAGSRRESSHLAVDMNYAQSFDLSNGLSVEVQADGF